MKTNAQKHAYRVRYVKVLEDLSEISQMRPRDKYMYRLMDMTIFRDFETALDVVIEDYQEAHNDNIKQKPR